jgi:hypothetical protein
VPTGLDNGVSSIRMSNLAMAEEDGGKTRVRVHQLVKSLQGDVLSDSEVSTYSP